MSRGNAVLEALVLGTVSVAVVLSMIVGAVRVQNAGERAEEAARIAADTAARWGDAIDGEAAARTLVPGADVTVERSGDSIIATVSLVVPLIGPEGSPLTATVRGRAEAQIAPHRSAR